MDLKTKRQLQNADEIIKTQAAEIARLNSLFGTAPVDEGPRIARLEQALREQVQASKHYEKESLTRLAIIERLRKLPGKWTSCTFNGRECADDLRMELSNGSENEATG